MTIIDYYKQQSKLLLKDYKLFKENNCNQNESAYLDPQEHFDINNVLSKINKQKGDTITLMNAQHILAKISDFKDWNDLLRSSDAKREIGALKLNCYKIGMDQNIISSASMLVHHELFAEFVDKNGDVNCTDEEELHVWKSVMERLLF